MYGIALSVAACLRAGTRVDVAWILDHPDSEQGRGAEAVGLTPGGGKLGSLLSGALDGQLGELAAIQGDHGRVLQFDVGAADAAVSGIEPVTGISCVLVQASKLPPELWERLLAREAVCLLSDLEGDAIVSTSLYTADSIDEADDDVCRIFQRGTSASQLTDTRAITGLWPVPQLIMVGGGDIADSLVKLAEMLGWNTVLTRNTQEATGLIASTSPLDSVVVAGHDLELTGPALSVALEGDVGYIGAIGPRRLQEAWVDWLSYRGQTDLSRLHGPAGLEIGAQSPDEIALAVAAQIVANRSSPKAHTR